MFLAESSAPVDSGPVTQDYLRDEGATFSGQLTHDFNGSNTAGVLWYDFGMPPGPVLGKFATANPQRPAAAPAHNSPRLCRGSALRVVLTNRHRFLPTLRTQNPPAEPGTADLRPGAVSPTRSMDHRRDAALMAWLVSHGVGRANGEQFTADELATEPIANTAVDVPIHSIEMIFERLGAEP